MKGLSYLLLFLLEGLMLNAQQQLQAGDKPPDWKFTILMNNPSPTLRLSEFKGKVILLVFWNTGCTSNYDILPELADLQRKFKSSLKIILISEDETDKVNAFFARRKSLAELGLPMVVRDVRFSRMCPHSAIPHVIFIGKDGKIEASGDPSYVTLENIQLLALGKNINVPALVITGTIDLNTPLAASRFTTPSNLLFSSTLTTSFPGIPGEMGFKKLDKARRKVYMLNSTISDLYSFAYEAQMNIKSSDFRGRLILNEKEKALQNENIREFLHESQKYCYELILPEETVINNKGLLLYMQKDLDHYFSLSSKVEKRKTKCYVLRKINSTFNSNNPEIYTQNWANNIEFNNEKIVSIAAVLQELPVLSYPLITEDASQDNFTLILKKHYASIESLQTDLQKGGLNITIEEKELDFLVIDKL